MVVINLLLKPAACPVNFEFKNYTIITSKCKAPKYPADLCCEAFKDFACPFKDDLNDLSNNCSSMMFDYLKNYGNYPPDLFGSICRNNKIGLVCPALPPGAGQNDGNADSNDSYKVRSLSMLMVFSVGAFIVLFMWF
ncbi:GPI-anchored protein LLG1-like [Rutidosis leptorrhynchoides]|uniref:GPI-anchored protein LLG1-like n=1 Tax=Rutidosis leptorrhynchoides TaxID=125765 RepID=UPI003A9A0021